MHVPEKRETNASLSRARDFVLREARLLDRHRFAHAFDHGAPEPVMATLLSYRNLDGGFGNALEPDIRAAASQPVPLEHALQILDEIERFEASIVEAACDWLVSVSTSEGGVPFVLPSVDEGPHTPWWIATGESSLNPTAGIVGLLHKHGVTHTWLDPATEFCWAALESRLESVGSDDAISVLTFLQHAPDRHRGRRVFKRLAERIRGGLVALDPDTPGYVKSPLDFAPRPDSLARELFDDETIGGHLQTLAARQREDGGWPITWEAPSAAAVSEWRGFMTVKALEVLSSYGYASGS